MRTPDYVYIVQAGTDSIGFFDLIDANQYIRAKWPVPAAQMPQFYEIVELLEKTGKAPVTPEIQILRIPMAEPRGFQLPQQN